MATPINPISLQEAEINLSNWAQRFKAVMDEAEALADYDTAVYTEENRAAGALATAITSEGSLVPWTVEDLANVNTAYTLPRQVATFARQGSPSILRKIHALIRSVGR